MFPDFISKGTCVELLIFFTFLLKKLFSDTSRFYMIPVPKIVGIFHCGTHMTKKEWVFNCGTERSTIV